MAITLLKLHCDDQGCPLSHRKDFVPAELIRNDVTKENLHVLFVGEGPAEWETRKHRPFFGVSGTSLRKAIRYAMPKGVDFNYGFSNMVRCWPLDENDKTRPPSQEEMRHCRHFLMRDIEKADPDVIVALGRHSGLEFIEGFRTVQESQGFYEKRHIAGRDRIVMSTWHPAFVGRQKKVLPVWIDDIKMSFRLAQGWWPNKEWGQRGKSTLLKTVPEILEYCDHLQFELDPKAMVATDVETANLHKVYGNKLAMIQFAEDIHEAYCIPLDHPQTPLAPDEVAVAKERLVKLFTDPVSFRYWLTHGGKFEQTLIGHHILKRGEAGNRPFRNAPMIDTMAFAYVLNENKAGLGSKRIAVTYGLKSNAQFYLRFRHYEEAALEKRAGGNLLDLPLDSLVPFGQTGYEPNLTDYGGMDAYVTKRLFEALREEAVIQRYYKKAMALLEHLFSPVFRTLSIIERNGFWANLQHVQMLKDPKRSPIIRRLDEIEEEIKSLPTCKKANEIIDKKKGRGNKPLFYKPWRVDLAKTDHVRTWLVDILGLEPLSRGKTGVASVGKEFLHHHSGYPEVDLVSEHRGLAKLKSAYANQIIGFIDPKRGHEDCQDGRVRCDIHFTSTVTGRASASNPNMQQQVRSDSDAKAAIKNIFQAEQPGLQDSFTVDFKKGPPALHKINKEPKNALVQLDFKTNEVRWWGIISQCPALAEAFNNGKKALDAFRADPTNDNLRKIAEVASDIHKQTASTMYQVAIEDVVKDQRQASKNIVFGWMFGRGVRAIAAQLKNPDVEAVAKLIEKFGNQFPTGRDHLDDSVAVGRRQGFIDSLIGRRRRLPGFAFLSHDMEEDDRIIVAECDRMAKNSPIQGIASDAAFIGTSLFCDYIVEHQRWSWLAQNVVHDSCVYQVPIAELEESVHVAEDIFTNKTMQYMTEHWGVEFPCPIEVDFEIGLTWGKLHKWDFTPHGMHQIVENLKAA